MKIKKEIASQIEDIVVSRNRALEGFERGLRVLGGGLTAFERATGLRAVTMPADIRMGYRSASDGPIEYTDIYKKYKNNLDRRIWERISNEWGFGVYLDEITNRNFIEGLKKEVPEVTTNTLRDTYSHFVSRAKALFEKSVFDVGGRVREKVGYEDIKIPDEIFLKQVLAHGKGYWKEYSRGREFVEDLDRIFHVVGGQVNSDTFKGAAAEILKASKEEKGTVQTPYFDVVLTMSGDAKVSFRRLDLLKKINDIIVKEHKKLPKPKKVKAPAAEKKISRPTFSF